MRKLFYLSVMVFVFTSFVACTTESVEEEENLQNFETQSDTSGSGFSGGSRAS